MKLLRASKTVNREFHGYLEELEGLSPRVATLEMMPRVALEGIILWK